MSAVYFQNAQWRVTDAGLECVKAAYLILPETLSDKPEEHRVLTWHLIMRSNAWVDLPAFFEAFRKAVELHNVPMDKADIDLSERVALGVHKRREAA